MWFHPSALILALAVALDLVLGDPVYPAHPIRLIGYSLVAFEKILRRIGANAVVFLDVEIPGPNGLELLKTLPRNVQPIVVVVTAFDKKGRARCKGLQVAANRRSWFRFDSFGSNKIRLRKFFGSPIGSPRTVVHGPLS